ncbi:MAG: PTS sugar transporter subunit IIA [Myxococcota bacterium]
MSSRVGVLIVTHYRLGEEFLQALRLILPDAPPFAAVAVDPNQPVEEIRRAIAAGLAAAEKGEGVLVLTDMFGGTPSNISLSFLDEHHVEIVTGINLPMLVKLATLTEDKPLEELATFVKEYGQRNISVASQLLPGSKV